MLGLSEQDIERAVSYNELVDAMEEALKTYAGGNFLMPDRMHVHAGENTLLLMPCFAGSSFSTKIVSVFPDNAQHQMPVIQGLMILNDGQTGTPLALLNGSKLTGMRTAAVGSVGVRYLSPENTESLGIIGAGIQGFYQAVCACTQRPIKSLTVYSRRKEPTMRFIEQLETHLPSIRIEPADSSEDLLERSQLVICATSSRDPVLPDDIELLRGKTIIGVGSFKPDMMEFSRALYDSVETIFVDTEFASRESGDLAIPLEKGWITEQRIQPLAKLITGEGSASCGETGCFKSVGMALFDLFAARLIYRRALEKELGNRIDL